MGNSISDYLKRSFQSFHTVKFTPQEMVEISDLLQWQSELEAARQVIVRLQSSDTAHEIWAASQLMPGEGIEEGVNRVVEILRKEGG